MKRKKLGRSIETPRIYERNITKEEKLNGSPYWAWMEKNGRQDEDGNIQEFPQANPDVLAEGEAVQSESYLDIDNMKDVFRQTLSEKQAQIMILLLEGYTQLEIARNIGAKQGYVSRVIKVARKKLEKYFD